MTGTPGTHRAIGSCGRCGKVTYESRKHARRAARDQHPGKHMAAYRCPHTAFWHLGHLAPIVARGRLSRAQIYGGAQ